MEAFIISFFVVAMAEMGDKTQLIALCLASRFRKPVPIILGILAATLASHLTAGLAGQWIGAVLTGNRLHWLLGLSFLAAALWVFVPDKVDGDPIRTSSHHSIFIT